MMNFKFRSRKCFRSIWKIHEELGCFDLIFGMYVEWRFERYKVHEFLEILVWNSPESGRGRRPELQLRRLSCLRVFAMCLPCERLRVCLIGEESVD